MYNRDIETMKKSALEKKRVALGWYLKRHGGNHDIWTNGDLIEPIPRHSEIVEILAKKIYVKLNREKSTLQMELQ
jgi:mRNA interferase HicA